MTEIDVPLDEPLENLPPPPLPSPPPPPAWKPADWDDDGLDPALDRTTQMPDLGAVAANLGALGAAAPGGFGAAVARLRRGAGAAWAARQERLGAPHPDADLFAQVRPSLKSLNEIERWEARVAAQNLEVQRTRRALKAQLRVPVGLVIFLVLVRMYVMRGGLMTWVALAAVLGLLGALGAIAWRAGAADPGALGADLGADDDEELARETVSLDAATITGALKSAGYLKDDAGITVTKVKPMANGNGWSCWVKLPPNLPARKAIEKRHEIASYLDTVDGCIIMLAGTKSNRDLWIWQADHPPLSGPPTTSPMANAEGRVNGWKGIPLGLTIHGESIVARLAGTPGWLIAGDPGTGKSFLARLLALGVALDYDVQGIFMDPDASGAWEPFGRVGEYLEGSSPDELRAMVERLEELAGPELARRRAALAEYRRANPMGVAESKLTERIASNKAANLPLLVVFIDECHVLTLSDYRRRVIDALITLATQGRKWGIVPVLLTQYAANDNLPVEIRNVLKTRVCLSVATEGAARIALGDLFDSTSMDPVALTSDEQGAFYFHGAGHHKPDAPWVLGRSDLVDDNEVGPILDRAVRIRLARRPELLPAATRGEADEPEPTGGAVLTKELEPDSLEHLENLVAVFEPGEDSLRSVVIVDRLQARWPATYARLTASGMNRFLKPFALVTTKVNREGQRGLELRPVEHALIRLREERGQ